MARTAITTVVLPKPWDTSSVGASWVAADVANGNLAPMTGKETLLAFNSDAGGHNVTVTSAPDRMTRRTQDITEAIAAGTYRAYGPFPSAGWQQPDGTLYFSADNALVQFIVLRPVFA